MTTRIKPLSAFGLLLFSLLFTPLQLVHAQAPSGNVTFSFDTNAPVWDLSGILTFDQTMIGAGSQETPLIFALDVAQDARGKLTSAGVAQIAVGNDFVAASYTLKGNVSGGGNRPARASINVAMQGEDVVAGVLTQFKINIHYNLEANADERAFIGRANGSASFKQLGGGKIRSDVSVALPGNMDGSWSAQMNIIALSKLGGSANIVLSNGRSLPTRLTGSYSANTALAKVKLKGINEGTGISANFQFISSEEGIELQSVNGKILGQSVRQ